jgi:competence protein ComEC
MAVLYLAARVVDHRTPPWHALVVVAAGMVAANPLDVRDPGFMLTFGATGALLAAARWGRLKPSPAGAGHRGAKWPALVSRRWIRWVAASIAASIAVEIALMPVSAQAFSRVTTAGLALNLVAVPLMAVVQISGMAVALAGSIDTIGRATGWMAYASAAMLLDSARLVDLLPLLSRRVPPPGLLLCIGYYAGLSALLIRRRGARIAGAITVLGTWLAIGSGAPAIIARLASPSPGLRLTVFDVGQAEAMVLETGGASPLEIDAGGVPFGSGGFDIGARVLAPALWARGILRLGTLLITHGDPDHLGGGISLLHDFRPEELWSGIAVPGHEPSRELVATARRDDVRIEAMRRGGERMWGKARIRVLSPPEPDWERQRVRNDDSVVIEVTYGDVALLLTGDIGADVEQEIVPRLTRARMRILKVAHHGSRTSTSQALLEAWQPQIAIISCGRGNRFGHPTHDVLARLDAVGAQVLRTDRDGQITIETDGKTVRVRTFRGVPQ